MRRQYEATFLELLREVTLQTGGIIPPGMDDPLLGCDWANASAGVFPFRVLPARHALVTSTLEAMREYKYREGIMTYGANAFAVKEAERTGRTLDPGKLHHYETFYVTQASLARGEQRDVVEDFSSILVHTGSTHSGFEWGIEPWGDRDAGGNLPPHGWFAARYIALLRNMLVREEGMDLHLLSALSPAWIRTGEKIRVVDAPTDFGEVSFSLQTTEEGADLRLRCRFRVAPRKIRIHVPWFVDLDSARVDGLPPVQVTSGIDVSPEAREIHLAWRRRSPEPRLDYREGVRLFLDKWGNPRPERDVATIFPRLSRPVVVRADRLFLDEGVLILAPPDGRGSVLFSAPGIPPGPDSYESPLTFDKSTTVTAVTLQEDRMSAPVTVTLEKATPLAAVEVGKIARGIRLSLHAGAFSRLPSDEDLSDPVLSTEERLRIPGGAPEDDYLCVYQGFLHVPRKGIWTFFLTSDDGSRLSVGDRMVVDNDGLHARRQESGQVALCEGWHPLRVEFFERGGAASLTVEMEGPGMERQEVPAEHLYHCVSR
jgi:hypothetical protein